MAHAPHHDVVVIGAGLAGLRAAITLGHAGRDVLVLEAADAVGGRQRTDAVDDFLLDRGFQVLNPTYPAVRRWVDVQALRLKPFPVGVQVRREGGLAMLADPRRHPSLLAATLRSGLLAPRDAAALARWAAPALVTPRRVIRRAAAGGDLPAWEAWDRVGLTGPLRREVLEPFLSGVIADGSFETSDAFVRLLIRMFALGRPGLPERGIQALPEQLAAYARTLGAEIALQRRVAGLRETSAGVEVDVAGADPVIAGAVIVAVGPEPASELAPIPVPPTRGLQTWWFATDAAPSTSGMIAIDGTRSGPVVNTAVMSHVAPSYAPQGMHLVQATCLPPTATHGGPSEAPTEVQVRQHVAAIWGTDATDWRLLRRDDIPHALPAQSAPLCTRTRARLSERVYIAGDHRDTASIQGALVSGDRVARALLAGETG
ncbi:NAD(P)/FAD-dependent oxidoreductase [Microbacterium sp.]|uniref:NAD(P)/FAD-dependent oxidoreductase n=1 Tax=Microbacterium sp. TaxID=51671 RepID=UPI002606215A|nr:NAD(P)/FAD-dependent oxidoreductase [Microbacterium sp.]